MGRKSVKQLHEEMLELDLVELGLFNTSVDVPSVEYAGELMTRINDNYRKVTPEKQFAVDRVIKEMQDWMKAIDEVEGYRTRYLAFNVLEGRPRFTLVIGDKSFKASDMTSKLGVNALEYKIDPNCSKVIPIKAYFNEDKQGIFSRIR